MSENLFRILIRFLAILPLPVLRGMGSLAGWLLFHIPNRECRNAQVNLKLCFPELTEQQRTVMLRKTLRENATTVLEMPSVWYGDNSKWLARIDDYGVREQLVALFDQGKGVIFAMPHLGNFELSAHYLGQLGTGVGLYRPPRKKGLESVMLEGRNRPGKNNRMVPADRQGLKILYQALKDGEGVVILPDQLPKTAKGGAGVFAPFFGVPALTMTLVNRLAKKTGAPVFIIAFVRTGEKPGYRVIGQLADEEIAAPDSNIAARSLNRGIEKCVRQYPAQYQWTYRRFKPQPDGAQSPYK